MRVRAASAKEGSGTRSCMLPLNCRRTICLRWFWRRRFWVSAFSFWLCSLSGTSCTAGMSRPACLNRSEAHLGRRAAMLRLETQTGWWLVTHPDHARLAGAFAERWGNERFLPPEPREHVLRGIARHDDGWAAPDRAPQITRQGKPSAFSVELVGKYSAFEEIDLEDYLAVRDRAVRLIASEDAYAAVLISMHTYSLLSDHADRSTIAPVDLPLLDQFLDGQRSFQDALRRQIATDSSFTANQAADSAILDHFRLLQ